jgi:hypothetical protein
MAAWNQMAYKQAVVRGYARPVARWRHLINAVGSMFNAPNLPPVGTRLNMIYLSHVAVDDDDADVFAALLRYGCSPTDLWLGEERTSYFVLGLSSRHPLLRAIPRAFRRHTYRTNLYAVHWHDGRDAAAGLDDRMCQPEVALL